LKAISSFQCWKDFNSKNINQTRRSSIIGGLFFVKRGGWIKNNYLIFKENINKGTSPNPYRIIFFHWLNKINCIWFLYPFL